MGCVGGEFEEDGVGAAEAYGYCGLAVGGVVGGLCLCLFLCLFWFLFLEGAVVPEANGLGCGFCQRGIAAEGVDLFDQAVGGDDDLQLHFAADAVVGGLGIDDASGGGFGDEKMSGGSIPGFGQRGRRMRLGR